MTEKRFESVWDGIVDTPQEAESMKLRSALMMGIPTPRAALLVRVC